MLYPIIDSRLGRKTKKEIRRLARGMRISFIPQFILPDEKLHIVPLVSYLPDLVLLGSGLRVF